MSADDDYPQIRHRIYLVLEDPVLADECAEILDEVDRLRAEVAALSSRRRHLGQRAVSRLRR